jgi:uncharacterized membrane protein
VILADSSFSISGFAGIVGILAFIIIAFTLAGTALRVGKNTQTTNNYRDSALSWETKAKAQEGQIGDLENKLGDTQRELQELRGKVQILEEIASGRAAMEAMAGSISAMVSEFGNNLISREDFTRWQIEIRQSLEKISRSQTPP